MVLRKLFGYRLLSLGRKKWKASPNPPNPSSFADNGIVGRDTTQYGKLLWNL